MTEIRLGSKSYSRRCWIHQTALVLIVVFGASSFASGRQHRARLADGRSVSGRLESLPTGEFVFRTNAEELSLDRIRRIEFPRSSVTSNNRRPARVFHLGDGGRVTGELVQFGQESVTIRARGKTFDVPRRSVLAIDQVAGERQVLYEDFESGPLPRAWSTSGMPRLTKLEDQTSLEITPGDELRIPLKPPIAGGRVSVAFYDPEPKGRDRSAGVELLFQRDCKPANATIRLASESEFYQVLPSQGFRLRVQRVARKSGWQVLTVLFDEARFQILIGGDLLASGGPSVGSLAAIRFFDATDGTDGSNAAKSPAVLFDNLQISARELDERELPGISIGDEDFVVLHDGNTIYGDIARVDSSNINIDGVFGEIAIPWNRTRRIAFGERTSERETPNRAAIKTGCLARVKFHRFSDHPDQPGDELDAVIESVSKDRLNLSHPILGEIDVPIDALEWIEPAFAGGVLSLANGVRHLGNQHRSDFRHRQAAGTMWKGEFALESDPKGPAFLEVEVSEIEPAGENTPPASRFLSELRSGHLGTEVFLNGTVLGRLNDRISQRNRVMGRQTVRLPIPAGLLKAGKNTWRIEQKPRKDHPGEYDDCEVGPIRLLIEKKVAKTGRDPDGMMR